MRWPGMYGLIMKIAIVPSREKMIEILKESDLAIAL
jgi:hypothetical protein